MNRPGKSSLYRSSMLQHQGEGWVYKAIYKLSYRARQGIRQVGTALAQCRELYIPQNLIPGRPSAHCSFYSLATALALHLHIAHTMASSD